MTSDTVSDLGSMPPTQAPQYPAQSSSDRLWGVLCHLSYFFGFALLSFIFPMTVYLVMRTDSAFVTHHAREALNFHLSLLLYFICCAPLCIIGVGFVLIGALVLTGLICSIVAAVKASKGAGYVYPITIRFVR